MTSLFNKIEMLIKREKTSPDKKKKDDSNKSSSEILTELFGAFNAAPPKIEDNPVKKSRKSRKKHKKEKKKRSRSSSSSSDSDDSDYHKRKKRKKSKSRKRKGSERSPSPRIKTPVRRKLDSDVKIKTEVERIKSEDKPIKTEVKPIRAEVKPIKTENGTKIKKDSKSAKKENKIEIKTEPSPEIQTVSVKTEEETVIDASLIPMPESPDDDSQSRDKKSDASLFENDKLKGKIQIKNLKFSTVFEETVKKAEEEARKRAEKYEEGEYTDSSSSSVKEVATNANFPKSSDPGGILKAAEETKISEEEKKEASKKISLKIIESSKSSKKDKERDKSKDRSSSKSHKRSKSRSKRSRSRSTSRRRHRTSRDTERRRSRSRHRSRSKRSRSRGRRHPSPRHRERERDRERPRRSRSPNGVKLADSEKKRLLEVARRNAINMLKNGAVPAGAAALPPHTRNQVMAAIQSGGKSVDELTDFCKHLSKKEALGELSSVSSNDDDMSENEDTIAFHHPFLVKEKAPIIMNIRERSFPSSDLIISDDKAEVEASFTMYENDISRNPLWLGPLDSSSETGFRALTGGAPLPIKSAIGPVANKDELRLQFPVSSGSQHREKASEWVPVSPKKDKESNMQVAKLNSKPASKPEVPAEKPKEPLALPAPPEKPAPAYMAGFTSGAQLSSVPALPAPGPQAYPPGVEPPEIDMASIVSQKIAMIRKEQEENELFSTHGFGWSKNSSLGEFTGSTGAQILTPRELASGTQAWAKKDQLVRAAPVEGGMGMHLLQKMGWTPGQGLGKEGTGTLQPLLLEVKLDTRGLQAKEEVSSSRMNRTVKNPRATRVRGAAPLVAGGKHPVSLLGEYCSKQKLGPPEYDLCFECGPDHKKNFLFKVKVAGQEYQPAVASANKKQAKADAAQLALQKLGIVT